MTREEIENMREVVLPYVKERLLEINYENLGEFDAEEFTRDFNEILNLAIKALEQEPIKSVLEDIKAIINTSNRGTCDYFIVDEIEKYINKHISGK